MGPPIFAGIRIRNSLRGSTQGWSIVSINLGTAFQRSGLINQGLRTHHNPVLSCTRATTMIQRLGDSFAAMSLGRNEVSQLYLMSRLATG